LTDPQVLPQWFLPGDLRPGEGARFQFQPRGIPGFDDEPIDAEVVEVDPPTRLVMRWRATQLQTVVTFAVLPRDGGCRLSLEQQGFVGTRGTLRRRVLQRAYSRMLDEPLRAALAQVEEQDRVRAAAARRRGGAVRRAIGANRRNDAWSFRGIRERGTAGVPAGRTAGTPADSTAGTPADRTTGGSAGRTAGGRSRAATGPAGGRDRPTSAAPSVPQLARRRRRSAPRRGGRRALAAGGALLLVVVAAMAVLLDRVAGPRPSADAAQFGAFPAGGATGAGSSVSATYRTVRTFVGGYHASITINNLSSTPLDGWTAVVTLPPLGLIVQEVRGAQYQQTGKEVRFTPATGTQVVPPGTAVEVTFEVQGAGAPVACAVNSQPCSGLPG